MTFDSVLVYATGGVAFARGNSELNSTGSRFAVRFTSVGAVVGGGIEWMYRPTLSFRLEGLHYMFNDQQTSGELTDKLRTVSVIRWGASWHFGPGGGLPFLN
jgi:opacity protein-like surface antigen